MAIAATFGVGTVALVEVLPLAYEVPFVGIEVDETTTTWLGVFTVAVLIALSGFFSSSEIAMFSLPKHRIEGMIDNEVEGATLVKELKDDPHRLLVTILVGNNIVNIAMSSIATAVLSIHFGGLLGVILATFGITAIVLLFGESAPKSYAVENTESWAIRISRPLKATEYLLYPLIVLFDHLTRQVNKATGSTGAIETPYVTRDEIQDMIETGEREGVLDEEEQKLLQRIFRFTNTIAKEVMTPRPDMEAVAKEDGIEAAIQTCVRAGHERVPVYEGSLDNVLGVARLRDLIREVRYGEGDPCLDDVIRPTLHVPESKNVDELLTEMREERIEMVVVIDEFGTTEGLITIEDIVEEIVGEILRGGEEHPIEHVDDHTLVVRGEVNIEKVNEALDIDLPEGEEFETIAGFIFNRVGRLVEEGERITYDSVEIVVERVENTRIMQARIIRGVEPSDIDSDEE